MYHRNRHHGGQPSTVAVVPSGRQNGGGLASAGLLGSSRGIATVMGFLGIARHVQPLCTMDEEQHMSSICSPLARSSPPRALRSSPGPRALRPSELRAGVLRTPV